MDSVKWLIRLEALEREDESFYMTQRYPEVYLSVAMKLENPKSPITPVAPSR